MKNKNTLSGTCGSCSWEISDEGKLRIFPSNGKIGELTRQSFTNLYSNIENCPLFNSGNRSELIKEVVVEQGVVLKHSGARLFEDLSNCEKMDLRGLDVSEITNLNGIFAGCSSLKELNLGEQFLEYQFIYSNDSFNAVPRDLRIISQNIDAINLGFRNETIRYATENKNAKWSPKSRVKTNKNRNRNCFDIPNGR